MSNASDTWELDDSNETTTDPQLTSADVSSAQHGYKTLWTSVVISQMLVCVAMVYLMFLVRAADGWRGFARIARLVIQR